MRIKTGIILGVAMVFATVAGLRAQSPSVLHAFSGYPTDGYFTDGYLALSGSTLYGTSELGGSNNFGTVFSINTDGTGYTILHSFTGVSDGGVPYSDILLADGTLYGFVGRGTNAAGYASIFSLSTNGENFNTLYTFNSDADGSPGNPNAALTMCDGTLYGTLYQGGVSNAGAIFSLSTNGTLNWAYLFTISTDGENPLGKLLMSGGTLYGTARNGGSNGIWGTVYSIGTNGQNFTVLHTFNSGTNDAHMPQGGVILYSNMLYGTTVYGGTFGHGTVFAIGTNGSGYSILHSFDSAAGEAGNPGTELVRAGNTLYGTTILYGDSDLSGSIYSVNTDGSSFTTVYGFPPPSGGVIGGTNSDGGEPRGPLTMVENILYGTTEYGGLNGYGTVFSLPVVPSISALNISGTNLTLNGFNGIEGETCTTLSATNLTLPPGLWTPLATNILCSGGDFSITVTNGVNPAAANQFYLLQTTVP